MKIEIVEKWKLSVGKSPAEHGVYKLGYLWLAPTFRNAFWKVDPENGKVVRKFVMPDNVWGAPWVEKERIIGASLGGYIRCFNQEGDILWTVNPKLGNFISESITEAWEKYVAVQFSKGVAIVRKDNGEIVWTRKWKPEGASGQEPTFDSEERLLWVCKPIQEDNLVAYKEDGDVIASFTLPDLPVNYACPQIWDKYLIVICNKYVVVIDRVRKKKLWEKYFGEVEYGGEMCNALRGGPRVITPDGKLIVWTADGVFLCFDLKTGDEIWRLDLARRGYASSKCTAIWGYAGGTAADGLFIVLGRNNLPEKSGTPYDINKNRLFIISYKNGDIVSVSEPKYRMACCCKPIVAKGKVIIGSWYKDKEGKTYESFYYCWEIRSSSSIWQPLDRTYEWLGGLHHGGYSSKCLLGVEYNAN